MLGSSNQSYNTYLSNIADKGEADVFLVDSRFFPDCDGTNDDEILIRFYNNLIELNDRINEAYANRILLAKQIRNQHYDEGFLYNLFHRCIGRMK